MDTQCSGPGRSRGSVLGLAGYLCPACERKGGLPLKPDIEAADVQAQSLKTALQMEGPEPLRQIGAELGCRATSVAETKEGLLPNSRLRFLAFKAWAGDREQDWR